MSQNTYSWYTVQVLLGYEKKVEESMKDQIKKENLSSYFDRIEIPTQEHLEIKRGKKVVNKKKVFPGYILLRIILNEQIWHLVENTPKVIGFLGLNNKPRPISDSEVNKILQDLKETSADKKRIIKFEIGEEVVIIDGSFSSFSGLVEGIDEEKSKIKVSVSIFGRSTPVELDYNQVDKK